MKKSIKLLILIMVVVVLVGGLVAAKYFFKDDDADADDEEATLAVNALQQDDIVGVQYNYGEEVITLEKDGDVWYLQEDKEFPVEQAFPDLMTKDAAELKAKRLVSSDPDDFAEYGLDDPTTAYVFTTADGEQVTFLIGNHNNFGDTYYLNVAGQNEIYLIESDFLDDFDVGKAKLAGVPDPEKPSTDQVTGMQMTLDGEKTELQYYQGGLDTEYTGTLFWYIDRKIAADENAVRDCIGKAVSYSTNGCAAYHANDEQLTEFGLDAPVLTLSLQYTVSEEQETGETDDDGNAVTETVNTPKALQMFVGGQADDGSYYAKFDNSDAVYLLAPEYMDELREFDMQTLRLADVCSLSSDEVTSMDVTVDGQTHALTITRNGDDASYTLDGAKITSKKFDDFFSSIRDVTPEGFATDDTEGEEALRVVYHTNRYDHQTVTLRIMAYDRNLFVSHLDEGDGVLLNKRDVEAMQAAFADLK